MPDPRANPKPVTILVTCVGRRVELLQAFKAASRRLRIPIRLVATDSTATAPALPAADIPVLVPPISDATYIEALLEAVRQHHVDALIPTIDTDLPTLSEHRDAFGAAGCRALIGDSDVIAICRDKIETFRFLSSAGIDTPRTYLPGELANVPEKRFPLFIKPRFGSASNFVHRVDDPRALEFHLAKVDEPIVQEFVDGLEHTLDVYVGLTGTPRCVVPRARWQVRGGEVSKGVVIKDREVMDAGRRVVEALGASVRGLVTLQCIVTADRRIRFIEINPRFGGGAPLGIAAGADYPGWLLQELTGQTPKIAFDGFEHGTCMLRYDWSVFLSLGDDLTPRLMDPRRGFPEFDDS